MGGSGMVSKVRQGIEQWGERFPWLLWLPLVLIFFHKMAFTNLILARGDTFLYFYPYWQAAADALQNGRVPLWNPHLFMGAPLLANSQVGFFYPLNWPLWWWLPIPTAVKASILLHVTIAGWGAYLAGRRCLSLGQAAAVVTAVLFGLGGYLTAQVEHINQLQGLAWLPWFFVAVTYVASQRQLHWRTLGGGIGVLALLFSLQLSAGHTQTTFITAVALVLWCGAQVATAYLTRRTPFALRFSFYGARFGRVVPLALLLGGGLALLIMAVQLLPTLELAQLSSRRGGLPVNEVLSFSLHPLLLTQSLLPQYGQSLFSEYVAFLPLSALMLAVVGAWQWRQWRGVLPAVVLVVAGLLLALGYFNPLNWLLARLPGFNLFRVPARWLILYTFGLSLLAGLGWQIAFDRWQVHARPWPEVPERARENLWTVERPLRLAVFVLVGLLAWGTIAQLLAVFIPTGPEAPYERASVSTVLLWGAELIFSYLLLAGQRLRRNPQGRWGIGLIYTRPGSPLPLAVVAVVVLFAASRTHPYHNLTTPAAYFDLRPSLARLQAGEPGRFLSVSDIFFDVGDEAELATIYGDQLPPAAFYDYLIAVKQKEIIGPNLAMAYGLASVDGFDGGILPLNSYSQFVQLLLPAGVTTTDGRLREHLDAIPAAGWLDFLQVRYLITDKVGDRWHEGVFFDLQHPVTLAAGERVAVGYVPDFTATEIWLVASAPPSEVVLSTAAGERWQLQPGEMGEGLYRVGLPQAAVLAEVAFVCGEQGVAACHIEGVTLVDGVAEAFRSVVLGQYRLIHSGDVKIYENLDVWPRAFMVYEWQWQPDVAGSLAVMESPGFAAGETAVLIGTGAAPSVALSAVNGAVTILKDEPEEVVLQTSSEAAGLLILTDSHYPGWQAALDGQSVPLYQADALFRGVMVPAGVHEVRLVFAPRSFAVGQRLSFLGMVIWLLGGLVIGWRKRKG